MVEGIATALGGMQKAADQADRAARIVAGGSVAAASGDVVELSKAALASGGLETAVVMLKTAALSYKANAEVLSSMLEMQAKSFEQLI